MADYESGYDPKYGYNKNAFAHGTLGTRIAGTLVKAISAPIGLTSEAIQEYRDKKRSKAEAVSLTSDPPTDQAAQSNIAVPRDTPQAIDSDSKPPPEYSETPDGDEVDWALDEIVASYETSDDPSDETSEQVVSFPTNTSTNGPLPAPTSSALPYPVILPQRRPGTKSRGFVRAYAPALDSAGISQDAFLQFLQDFRRAAQASPVFDVVMIATALAGAYPDPIVGAAVQAVQIVAGVGKEMQERWRTNKFLAQANKDVFMPRGLFAMVVTYKPTTGDEPVVEMRTVDWSTAAVARHARGEVAGQDGDSQEVRSVSAKEKTKLALNRLRVASAKSVGESQMPASCAPLIYPLLETAAAAVPEEERRAKSAGEALKATSKGTAKWLNDYYDRRAQAAYNFQNPDTTLARMGPETPQFKSRYADPNDAVNTHLITLLSGGLIKAEPLGAKRRWQKAQRAAAEKRAKGLRVSPTKRLLQEDVLYLMVVNMPSEEELRRARGMMEAQKRRRKNE